MHHSFDAAEVFTLYVLPGFTAAPQGAHCHENAYLESQVYEGKSCVTAPSSVYIVLLLIVLPFFFDFPQ